jgi:hypothetical protein
LLVVVGLLSPQRFNDAAERLSDLRRGAKHFGRC